MIPSSPPSTREVRRALAAPSVVRTVWLAVRDERLREAFAQLRAEGVPVADAIERLRGPHTDEHGRRYFLSDERVRAVVYQKGRRGGVGATT